MLIWTKDTIPMHQGDDQSASTLRVAVLQALAAHDRVRTPLAAIFAVLQDGSDLGLLDPTQERLLAFAKEAAQDNPVLMRWIDGIFRPVVVHPNGRMTTTAQQARASRSTPTRSPGADGHGC